MNTIIGISGVAGSGKDTFYELLAERMPCTKYSLADELKKEVNQWCRMHYGIDSVNCSREDKENIRPFLVFHGTNKRRNTNGRHWIEKINDKIIKDKFNGLKIVTDIRYDDYENDEASWLKDEIGGVLVHVSQYTVENTHSPVRCFKEPANSEEARNDPKLKEKSDYEIEWEFIKDGRIDKLNCYIDDFIKWLYLYVEARRHNFNKQNQEKRL